MRLYLSSYRFGEFAADLVAMAGGAGARVAVISNALDFLPTSARDHYARTVYSLPRAFADLGLEAAPLDLRHHFGRRDGVAAALEGVSLVWVTGGNAFLLRRAMKQSGFDDLIRRRLAEDALAYGGDSAGAVVCGPSLAGIEAMDPADVLAEGYPAEVEWAGLGLIDSHIVPHYRSQHGESEAADACAGWYRERELPLTTLSDGDVLIRRGGVTDLKLGARHRL